MKESCSKAFSNDYISIRNIVEKEGRENSNAVDECKGSSLAELALTLALARFSGFWQHYTAHPVVVKDLEVSLIDDKGPF